LLNGGPTLIRYLSKETRIKLLDYNPNLINYLGRRISKEEYQTAILKAPDILYSAQFNWSKYITPEEFLKIFQTYLEKNVNYFAPRDLVSANHLRALYSKFVSSPQREKLIYLILQFVPEAIINFIMIAAIYPELADKKYIDFAIGRANSISPKRGQDLTKVIKTDLADVVYKLIKST
jgi:hypothetical protein